jgi:hypothetical protein
MVGRVGRADVGVEGTPVFINNISKRSDVTCACCDKFKIDLNRTQISTKIIELLEEKMNTPNGTVSTDACYLYHNENLHNWNSQNGNGFMCPHRVGKETVSPK